QRADAVAACIAVPMAHVWSMVALSLRPGPSSSRLRLLSSSRQFALAPLALSGVTEPVGRSEIVSDGRFCRPSHLTGFLPTAHEFRFGRTPNGAMVARISA